MNKILMAICWFIGMGCSLTVYVTVFTYAYKAFVKGYKECIITAIIKLFFGCLINVIVNQISIKFGNHCDYLDVFFTVIIIGFYMLVLFKALNKRDAQFNIARRSLFFSIFAVVFRPIGVTLITKIFEMNIDISDEWCIDGIVFCFLAERLIRMVEQEIPLKNIKKGN